MKGQPTPPVELSLRLSLVQKAALAASPRLRGGMLVWGTLKSSEEYGFVMETAAPAALPAAVGLHGHSEHAHATHEPEVTAEEAEASTEAITVAALAEPLPEAAEAQVAIQV